MGGVGELFGGEGPHELEGKRCHLEQGDLGGFPGAQGSEEAGVERSELFSGGSRCYHHHTDETSEVQEKGSWILGFRGPAPALWGGCHIQFIHYNRMSPCIQGQASQGAQA